MPESSKAWVEVEFNYACDRDDGGTLFWFATVFDQQGVPAYDHHCTNPDDHETYRFTSKYPRKEFVAIDISQITL